MMADRRTVSPISTTTHDNDSGIDNRGHRNGGAPCAKNRNVGSGSGSYSTVRQNEEEDENETKHHNEENTYTKREKSSIMHFGWWWEVYAAALSVASTIAVVAVLISIQDKPLAEWTLPIQPNSLVAIFSTIAKSALLVPIAECLSQLKWSYFESTPRKLSQLQVFDSASRGPWGALVMLWKIRATALLASLGACITVLLLAFEPFTQQVVRIRVRDSWARNETSTVSVAPAFVDYRYGYNIPNKGVDPNARLTFTLAMMAAMTGRSSLYESNNVCGTSSCTYPSHVSLSTQTKCEERDVQTTTDFGCSYWTWNRTVLVNETQDELGVPLQEQHKKYFTRLAEFKDGIKQMADDGNLFKYGVNCSVEKQDFPTIYLNYEYFPDSKVQNLTGEGTQHYVPFEQSEYIPSRSTIFGNAQAQQETYHSYFGTDTLEPINITGSPFAFCTSQRLKDVATRFDTLDNFTLATFTCLDTPRLLTGIANLDTFGKFNATLSHCSISLAAAEYTNKNYNTNNNLPGPSVLFDTDDTFRNPATLSELHSLTVLEAGTTGNYFENVAISPSLPNNINKFWIRPYPMINLAEMLEQTLYSDNVQDFLVQRLNSTRRWPSVIQDIGIVAGQYIRSSSGNPDAGNITGQAWTAQPYIRVDWSWFILPLLLVLTSVVFLGITAIQSRRRVYLYKSSILAGVLLGLEGWRNEDIDKMIEQEKRARVMGEDYMKKAEGINARLIISNTEGVKEQGRKDRAKGRVRFIRV